MLLARRISAINHSLRQASARQASPFQFHRLSFWWGGDNDDKKEEKEQATAVIVEDGHSEKQLVAQTGEHSPKLSPLVVVPVTRRPIFPGFFATHLIKDEKTIDTILKNRTNGASYLGLFLRSDDKPVDDPGIELITDISDIHRIGTFAQIHNVIKTPRGSQLLLMAHRRISLDDVTEFGPPTIARVTHMKSAFTGQKSASVKAYSNEVVAAVR